MGLLDESHPILRLVLAAALAVATLVGVLALIDPSVREFVQKARARRPATAPAPVVAAAGGPVVASGPVAGRIVAGE